MRAACCEATVLRHEVIADDIRLLTALWPDREHVPHAGQFFTLRAWGADEAPFLSRPISVHKWDAETQTVEFLYAVVGEGTRKLTALKKGDSFQLTGPMGNGFDVADILSKYQKIAVVGGGDHAVRTRRGRDYQGVEVETNAFAGTERAHALVSLADLVQACCAGFDEGNDARRFSGDLQVRVEQVGVQIDLDVIAVITTGYGRAQVSQSQVTPRVARVEPHINMHGFSCSAIWKTPEPFGPGVCRARRGT